MKGEERPFVEDDPFVVREESVPRAVAAQLYEIEAQAESIKRGLESQERLLKIQKNYDIAFQLFVFLVLVFVVGPEIRDLLYAWIASRGS
ncbi:MAG: hypothetical protein ISN26_08070 [Betaproteobacteria bacterium AqS2]|uniref:Uncharacterized protein n=1 Tax=Candidatus Amphirhobacter heronislandensis TaxID=1732024 RepID=A0A930XYQ9_9GAMM|nr:hypothetical protein [Betaproteobacteria bacterium AqS2]